ncbi:MAG TPA: hypothetical protein PKA88_30130 [Polyangiaceae bacterium]|nr:hypothetical protein [Polyangiaceae bacterium]HMR75827.1 hypothetical protein [Polyangiaceae bacterium]
MSHPVAFRVSRAAEIHGLSCTSIRARFERRTLGFLLVRPATPDRKSSVYRILGVDACKLDPLNDDWREIGVEVLRGLWKDVEHVTVPQFSAALDMSEKLVRTMAITGEVPFQRIGRDWVLDAQLGRTWLEAHYRPALQRRVTS